MPNTRGQRYIPFRDLFRHGGGESGVDGPDLLEKPAKAFHLTYIKQRLDFRVTDGIWGRARFVEGGSGG